MTTEYREDKKEWHIVYKQEPCPRNPGWTLNHMIFAKDNSEEGKAWNSKLSVLVSDEELSMLNLEDATRALQEDIEDETWGRKWQEVLEEHGIGRFTTASSRKEIFVKYFESFKYE